MLITLGVIFLVLWAVGFIGFHVVSWFIHVLLILALISFVIRLVNGGTTAARP